MRATMICGMYNIFTTAQIRSQGIAPSLLTSSLACCVLRLSRGIYVVARRCGRHVEFGRFADEPALFDLRVSASAGPPASTVALSNVRMPGPGDAEMRPSYVQTQSRPPTSARPLGRAAAEAALRRAEHCGVIRSYPHLAADVVGGVSAAVIHGIPLLGANRTYRGLRHSTGSVSPRGGHGIGESGAGAITVGRPGDSVRVETWSERRSRASQWLLRRNGVPADDEIVDWHGIPVASAARSCVDLARVGTAADGVVAADWYLSGGYAHGPDSPGHEEAREALGKSLALLHGRPGAARAHAAISTSTGRAESPAESLALYCCTLLEVRGLEQQVEIRDRDGLVGRVDFLLVDRDGRPVVLEVDGAWKYADAADGRSGDNPLFREKRREDRLRRAGYGVLRLTWSDLMDLNRMRSLLQQANVI